MKSHVRLVLPADTETVLDIYSHYIRNTTISFETEIPTNEEFRNRIHSITQKYPWIVIEKNGNVLGYAYAGQHRIRSAYQWSVDVAIYLDPANQGKGFGKKLYTALLAILKQQGFHNAYAGITLPNSPSVKLHEFFGFRKIGTYSNVGFKLNKWCSVGWWGLEFTNKRITPTLPTPITELPITLLSSILKKKS